MARHLAELPAAAASGHAPNVCNLFVTDRANCVRRHGHHGQRLAGQRRDEPRTALTSLDEPDASNRLPGSTPPPCASANPVPPPSNWSFTCRAASRSATITHENSPRPVPSDRHARSGHAPHAGSRRIPLQLTHGAIGRCRRLHGRLCDDRAGRPRSSAGQLGQPRRSEPRAAESLPCQRVPVSLGATLTGGLCIPRVAPESRGWRFSDQHRGLAACLQR